MQEMRHAFEVDPENFHSLPNAILLPRIVLTLCFCAVREWRKWLKPTEGKEKKQVYILLEANLSFLIEQSDWIIKVYTVFF